MPRALLLALVSSVAAAARAGTITVAAGGGEIEMAVDGDGGPARADLEHWLARGAQAISGFYGRLPVPRIRIQLAIVDGGGISGTAYMGRFVRMRMGSEVTRAELDRDWTLTHELFHLAFPSHDTRLGWLQEGMATYFEPIARARVGDATAEEVWTWLCEGLPKGLPESAGHGLNERRSWGATYWGGALFWLMVDVGIREETANRRSADDALRGILAAGGDGTEEWPIARILEVGDRATGTTVLSRTYQRMAVGTYTPDVERLERRLGVERKGGKLSFHDDAPLAAVRKAITAPAAR